MRRALSVAAVLTLAPCLTARAETLTPFSMINVSEAVMRAYNSGDAAALHDLLSPDLKDRYTPDMVRTALALCRVLTGEIFRLSTPSWGTRSYGFFGLYAETGVFDMVLEIDPAERIVHWVVSDNVTAREQQCRIGAASDAGR